MAFWGRISPYPGQKVWGLMGKAVQNLWAEAEMLRTAFILG